MQDKKTLDCYIVSDLRFLIERLPILPKTSPFLSAQMAMLSNFFQMFIVLGMYNFATLLGLSVKKAMNSSIAYSSIILLTACSTRFLIDRLLVFRNS